MNTTFGCFFTTNYKHRGFFSHGLEYLSLYNTQINNPPITDVPISMYM